MKGAAQVLRGCRNVAAAVLGGQVADGSRGANSHIVTDTIGPPVALAVHGADIQDRDSAPDLLKSISTSYPLLRHVFADGGYAGPEIRGALEKIGRWTLRIVKRSETAQGFEFMPCRWVVERTFAWPADPGRGL